MSGNENADELQARLRAMREGRRAPQASGSSQQQPPTGAPANWHARSTTDSYNIDDELEELQSMISDGSYLSRPPGQTPYINNNTTNSTMTYTTTANGTGNGTRFGSEVSMDSSSTMPLDESALWSDHRPTARSYVEEDDTPRGLGGAQQQQQQQQQQQMRTVARQSSYSRGASLPNAPNAHGDVSYESAFRLIQQAADAERNADPLMAIQLYTDAGDLLVRVGKTETDPLLKQGIKEKATEIMKRAEELDQWYYSLQENIRKAALPPQLKIQKTSVPRVQESWHARRPPFSQSEEFTHMRYTAVTTKDPFHFTDDGFQLRVDELQRKVRTFITITMYNEEGSELKGTLTGIARNLQYMCELWGEKAWENVAVAVVSDGRTKASASCLDFLTSIGAFDEEIMTVTSVGVDTQMHLFESTIQLVRDDNFEAYYPPIQLIYALKEHNGGKLNSHLWFFNAFSEQLLPTYTVLVDVGTIPGPDSVYRLVRTMDRNHQIGGVAGEIAVEQPNYFNPVIAAQHFEYKISNIMDKSLESVFGFISVLPGAFSAYRYEAIRAEKGVGPLPEYFRSLTTSTKDLGPFKGNMYLAEDRILCFELLARKGRKWTMHYVKDAIARTDVPETLVDLIKQRRRWLNGSFFAGLFAISNFGRVWKESGHSFPRKCVLTFQFVYLFVQNVLSWFLLSNLFLTFYYVLTLVLYTKMRGLLQGVLGVYSALIGGTVIFALGNKPEKRTAAFYSFSFIFFGLVMAVVSSISIYGLSANIEVKDPREDLSYCKVTNFELTGGVVTALGLVYASAFLHGEFSVLLSTFQYFFMLPTFVNILGIYAYSNLHDLSWGTKGLETATGHGPVKSGGPGGGLKEIVAQQKRIEAEKQRAAREKEDVDNSFRAFRSTLLLFWLVTNAAWVYGMTNYVSSSCYLQGLSYVVAVFNITRFLGAVVFLVFRIVRRFGGPSASADGDAAYQANLPPEWQSHYGRGGVSTTATGATSLPLPKTAPGQVQIEIASPTAHYREQTL